MLKKLLKYDLKSVFKYWWIAAITTLGLSVLGGFAITVLRDAASEGNAKEVPIILEILATTFIPVMILGIAAFSILTTILIFVRYYKNFFSDEGYLTFTLPVKKTELINSKLLMSGISMIAELFVIIIDVLVMLGIGFFDKIIKCDFWKAISEFFSAMYETLGGYTFVYALEIIVIFLVVIVFSNLFLYNCIGIACMLAKKAKVVTAIAIYYIASGAISTISTIFYLFGMSTIITKMSMMETTTLLPFAAFLVLGFIVMIALFTAILYILQYWIVDRKLNLS